jgi:hypothetical protein
MKKSRKHIKNRKYLKSRKHIKNRKYLKNRKHLKSRKHIKSKKHIKSRKHLKSRKHIKLIIKDLGKKTKKYKRIQYGCKSMKGGGPIFQPFTYINRTIENGINNTYNTMYGNDSQEYNYTNY